MDLKERLLTYVPEENVHVSLGNQTKKSVRLRNSPLKYETYLLNTRDVAAYSCCKNIIITIIWAEEFFLKKYHCDIFYPVHLIQE